MACHTRLSKVMSKAGWEASSSDSLLGLAQGQDAFFAGFREFWYFSLWVRD